MENLKFAFPEKTEKELEAISRSFYRKFCDNWFEMLKIMSLTKRQAAQKITYDYSVLETLYKTGKAVQGFTGHFMNWEYVNVTVPNNQPYPFLGVYIPISSPIFERLIHYLRCRFGTVMLKAGKMNEEMEAWDGRQYLIGLGADQSPSNPQFAYWMYFMNRPTGFIQKPWKKARELNDPIVYMRIHRGKRGYYHFEILLFEMEPARFSEAELAIKYKNMLEADIRSNPDNYLWSHRRWKLKWKEEYAHLWIDEKPMPYLFGKEEKRPLA